MLWCKAWLETRWRFLVGLALLAIGACGVVLAYPRLMALVPVAESMPTTGELGRQIKEGVELVREYRGYVWSQWFRQMPTEVGTLFAVLLGTETLVSQTFGGAALFTLSLPASRRRVLGVRAAAGLAEWFVLALVPSLVVSLMSPAVGQRYPVGDALVHGVCIFVAGAVFFSLAVLLSSAFGDLWRPLLVACLVAVLLGLADQVFHDLARYSIFHVMSGEVYFRTRAVPWGGLFASAAVSASLLYGASINIARRDF